MIYFRLTLFVLFWALLCAAYLVSNSSPQNNESVAIALQPELFSGEPNHELSFNIFVRNDGPNSCRIKNVMTGCSCAASEVPTSEILPGEGIEIPVTVQWGIGWGIKLVEIVVVLDNGQLQKFEASLERYPRLQFSEPYVSVVSSKNGNCEALVELVSFSEIGTEPANPTIKLTGAKATFVSENKKTVAHNGFLKNTYTYNVSAESSSYLESVTSLAAIASNEHSSCSIQWFFKCPVHCEPESLFLGSVHKKSTTISKEVVFTCDSMDCKSLAFESLQGSDQAFEVSSFKANSDGKFRLLLKIDASLLPFGPFYRVLKVNLLLDGKVTVVPIRVSGNIT